MKDLNFETAEEFFNWSVGLEGINVLQFSSESCTWCPSQVAVLEELKEKHHPDLGLYHVDITSKKSAMRRLARDLGVKILPSLMIIKDGETMAVNDPRFPNDLIINQHHTLHQCNKIIELIKAYPGIENVFNLVFWDICAACRHSSWNGEDENTAFKCLKHTRYYKTLPDIVVTPFMFDGCASFNRKEKFRIYSVF